MKTVKSIVLKACVMAMVIGGMQFGIVGPASARCWWEPFAGDVDNNSNGQWMTIYDGAADCGGSSYYNLGPGVKSESMLRDVDSYTDNRYFRSHTQTVRPAWHKAVIHGINIDCNYVGQYYDGIYVRLNCV